MPFNIQSLFTSTAVFFGRCGLLFTSTAFSFFWRRVVTPCSYSISHTRRKELKKQVTYDAFTLFYCRTTVGVTKKVDDLIYSC